MLIVGTTTLRRARMALAVGAALAVFALPVAAQIPSIAEPATANDAYRDAVIREDAGYPMAVETSGVEVPLPPLAGEDASIEPRAVTLVPRRAIGWPNVVQDPVDAPPPGVISEAELKQAGPVSPAPAAEEPPRVATRQHEDLWSRIRAGFAMPDLESGLVVNRQSQIASHPQLIKLLVERSRRYLFHIVEEIEKRGMPTELALLPMVESAFDPMAYSRAHASGLWQFIPSTGRNFNLEQTWWYDARRDIVASTQAALEYLQKIYEMHGDWHLALASYNFGEFGVARAVERNRRMGLAADYASLALPAETRHYVPRLQAIKNIIANPERFGVELDPIPNEPYFATVTLTRDIDLHVAARLADMPVDELVALNPGHNRPVIATAKAPTLVLPADRLDNFIARLATHDKPLSAWRVYSAQRGERIEDIAAKHGVAVDNLRKVNGVRGVGRLQTDAQLLIPTRAAEGQVMPGPFAVGAPTIAAEVAARVIKHVIKAGETWEAIAKRYRVSANDLQSWNPGARLVAGAALTVQAAAAAATSVKPAKRARPGTVTARAK